MIGGGAFNRGMIPRKQNPVAVPSTLGSQVSEPVQAPQRPPQPPAQPASHIRPPSTPRQWASPPAPPAKIKPVERGPELALIGRFRPWPWGQWPDESYMADALEEAGVKVHRVEQESGRNVVPCATALFTGHPGSWSSLPIWHDTHFTALWTLDLIPGYAPRIPMMEMGKRADLFITSDKFSWAQEFGVTNHAYLPGACEGITPPFQPNPVRSCAFLGTIYNERRKSIAAIIKKMGGVVIDQPGKWLYRMDLAHFLQNTKVIIGDNSRNDILGYWSTRNYVIPGAGGFLLTAEVPGLAGDFDYGVHIATYKSIGSLEASLAEYIANDEEREKIRKNGFFHVRANHTWSARARTMIQILGIKLPK